MAAVLPRTDLERALEQAERQELFDLAATQELIQRSRGHRGIGRLRRAIDSYRPAALTRSELERRFLGLIRAARLPEPSVNCLVEGHVVDLFWPHRRLVVELDGFETHRTRRAFEHDRRRDEDLKLAGIDVLRLTWRRIKREPREVVERLGTLLRVDAS
jgi:very-short-patch-repair endonuclease